MNDLELLDVYGPDAPAADLAAARSRLLDEVHATVRPRWRRPAVLASVAAVALALALVIPTVLDAAGFTSSSGSPTRPVTLVTVNTPTFPLSLAEIPQGLAAPNFSYGDEYGGVSMGLPREADHPETNVVDIAVSDSRPEPEDYGAQNFIGVRTYPLDVNGVAGEVTRAQYAGNGSDVWTSVHLTWEREPSQWVTIRGTDEFSTDPKMLDVAALLSDEPTDVLSVALTVAPKGWSLSEIRSSFFFSFHDDASDDPERRVTVVWRPEVDPGYRDPAQLMGDVRSITEVSVDGRQASIVDVNDEWLIQVPFPDGSAFTLQAPRDLTREQIIEMAAGVRRS